MEQRQKKLLSLSKETLARITAAQDAPVSVHSTCCRTIYSGCCTAPSWCVTACTHPNTIPDELCVPPNRA